MNGTLYSFKFIFISFLFAVVISITAVFFSFAGYLESLGLSSRAAGMILGLDALASLMVQLSISPFMGPRNAKRWLLAGCLIYASALFLLGCARTVPLLALFRMMQGTGLVCVQAPMLVMLVQIIPPDKSGQAFGIFTLVRLLPYAVIPFVFDLVHLDGAAFKTVLNVAALTALLPLAALLLSQSETDGPARPQASAVEAIRKCFQSGAVVYLMISSTLVFSSYSALFYYIRPYGQQTGSTNAGLFFSLASAAMILVRLCCSHLFDRIDKVRACAAAMVLTGICYVAIPLFPATVVFLGLAVLMGVGWGISMPLQAAVLFDISDPSVRAVNQNMLMATVLLGFFCGPLLGGLAISTFGYTVFFFLAAALTALAALLMGKTAIRE